MRPFSGHTRSCRTALMILCCSAFLCTAAHASAERPISHAAWMKDLRNEALRDGISESVFTAAFKDFTPVDRVVTLDRNQPEFQLTFKRYLNRALSKKRVRKARQKARRHAKLLAETEETYGIPKEYLLAFWGLETNFGAHFGGFNVPHALATLAFDTRRSKFFRKELFHALHILNDGHIAPEKMYGSWAGAMGNFQFMPSTFAAYAIDGDGDEKKDIWESLPDAFGSAANYLSKMRWREDERWGREVRLPKGFDFALTHKRKPLKEWSNIGIMRSNGKPLPMPKTEMSARLILPSGHQGPAFLVYHNFDVILHWNRSDFYALAVGILADKIAGRETLSRMDWPDYAVPTQTVKHIQAVLKKQGYSIGKADGIIGSKTKKILRKYQEKSGFPPDGHLSEPFVKHFIKTFPPKIPLKQPPLPDRKPVRTP